MFGAGTVVEVARVLSLRTVASMDVLCVGVECGCSRGGAFLPPETGGNIKHHLKRVVNPNMALAMSSYAATVASSAATSKVVVALLSVFEFAPMLKLESVEVTVQTAKLVAL